MSTTKSIQEILVDEIRNVAGDLPEQALRGEASLTLDLGLDSVHLTSLFATVKRLVGEVELAPWFIRNSRDGTDTIGSLAAYLGARAAPRRAAA